MTDLGAKGSNLVTVSCADHGKYVAIALRNLFDTKRGTDFDLRLDGRSLRAHRVILELFLAPEIIGSNVVHPEVKQEVPDSDRGNSYNVLESMMEFLYKGEVAVPKDQLLELLSLAREMDFQMLEDAITLSSNCKIENTDNFRTTGLVGSEGLFGVEISEARACHETVPHAITTPNMVVLANLGLRMDYDSNVPTGDADSPLTEVAEPKTELVLGGMVFPNFEVVPSCCESGRLQFESHCTNSEPDEASMAAHSGLDDDSSFDSADLGEDCGVLIDDLSNSGAADDNHFILAGAKKPIETKQLKCPHCEYRSLRYNLYYNHLSLVHGLTPSGEPAPLYSCTECDFSTPVASRLGDHQRKRHSNERAYACTHCSYKGKLKGNLTKHLNVVHGVGDSSFSCVTCGKRCSSRFHLDQHNRTHSNERPYKCPHCDFASKAKSNLNKHVRKVH